MEIKLTISYEAIHLGWLCNGLLIWRSRLLYCATFLATSKCWILTPQKSQHYVIDLYPCLNTIKHDIILVFFGCHIVQIFSLLCLEAVLKYTLQKKLSAVVDTRNIDRQINCMYVQIKFFVNPRIGFDNGPICNSSWVVCTAYL